jgi:hypothetical protein
MTSKPSEEYEKFDKAMEQITSVTKEELDSLFSAYGARYPQTIHPSSRLGP